MGNPNSASTNGYAIRVNSGSSFLIRHLLGAQTTIGGNAGAGADGDIWGLQSIGTSHYVWRWRTGTWTLVWTATDGSVMSGGYLGLASGDDATIRVDNFGGGNFPSAAVGPFPSQFPHVTAI
jgi:hypothetical protein